MQDRHGRVIDHLRLSVTDRCGLRCIYCLPNGEPPHAAREEILSFEEFATVVRFLHDRHGLSRVRITGGEPLARPHLENLVALLSAIGLEEIALTTNGQLLARSMDALAAAGLTRLNISVDTLDPDRYRKMTGAELAPTLEGVAAADRSGLRPLKINAVVIRDHNEEDVEALALWALERGYEMRFLELMAIGCVQTVHPQLMVPTREVRERLMARFRLEPLEGEPGAPARTWSIEADGRRGTVGFISPETEPFCLGCRRLRMTAKGKFLGCIMHDDGPDVRSILRAPEGFDVEAFDRAVSAAIESKPISRVYVSFGHMMAIGG
jgi:cyclic pyranopterin phosphate synthase